MNTWIISVPESDTVNLTSLPLRFFVSVQFPHLQTGSDHHHSEYYSTNVDLRIPVTEFGIFESG